MYPKKISRKACYFHVTDREHADIILKHGLRPRYNKNYEYAPNGKELPWRQYKKDTKNEQFSKI